jgi:hypothetical protein
MTRNSSYSFTWLTSKPGKSKGIVWGVGSGLIDHPVLLPHITLMIHRFFPCTQPAGEPDPIVKNTPCCGLIYIYFQERQ